LVFASIQITGGREKKQYWLMTPGFGLAHTRVPSSRVLRSIEQIEEEAQA